MCRRCCCSDVFFWNSDSATNQLRVPSNTISPVVRYQLPFSPLHFLYAPDYRNERIGIVRNSSPFTSRIIGITSDFKLRNVRDLGIVVGAGSPTVPGAYSLACNPIERKLYYHTYKTNILEQAIHGVSYEGLGDVELISEPQISLAGFITATVQIAQGTLTYNPHNDRIYYIRQYTLFAAPPATDHYKSDLRSCKSDGSDARTECNLEDITVASLGGGIIGVNIFHSFFVPQQNAIYVGLQIVRGGAGTNDYYISKYDITTGARSDLLSAPSTQWRLLSPQFCYKDQKVYFCRQYAAGGNIDNTAFADYCRMNIDGSGLERVMKFPKIENGTSNPTNWNGSFNAAGPRLRLGCGFEKVGIDYPGVG